RMLKAQRIEMFDGASGMTRPSWGAYDDDGLPDPLIERFVIDLELRGYSPNTIRTYVRSAAMLSNHCTQIGVPVIGLNRRLFKGWLLSLAAPGTNAVAISADVSTQLSPSTFNTYYGGAKCFLAFALDREIDDLPFTAMPRALAQIPVHKLLSHIKAEVG